MSDPPVDQGVTREEFTALMGRLDALAAAQDELREASTKREREEATAAVEDTEDAFARAAKVAGLSRDQIASAVAKAKDEEEHESFKKHMDRYIAELPDDDDDKGDDDGKDKTPPKDDKHPKDDKPVTPPKDTEPVQPHWSDKAVTELLR